jgi:hypothetical protein
MLIEGRILQFEIVISYITINPLFYQGRNASIYGVSYSGLT